MHGKENNLSNFDFIYFKEDKEFNALYPEQSKKDGHLVLKDSYGQKEKFWVDVNWSKTSDSLVLRDIPGDITSIGDQRAQSLMQISL